MSAAHPSCSPRHHYRHLLLVKALRCVPADLENVLPIHGKDKGAYEYATRIVLSTRVCVRACVRACVFVCVFVCVCVYSQYRRI